MFVRGMTYRNELIGEEDREIENAVRRQVGRCNIPRRCANIAEGPSVRSFVDARHSCCVSFAREDWSLTVLNVNKGGKCAQYDWKRPDYVTPSRRSRAV